MRFLFGVVIGIILLPAVISCWFKFGTVPVAVIDPPLPFERVVTGVPLNARIDKEAPKTSPVEANEATFVAGAHIYRDQCAFCHGTSRSPSVVGKHMFPDAPPLWEKHQKGDVVGVSDDPSGETYWKVSNGIRLTGMPAYKAVLSETEMWQVSVLLANANKPLPPAALALLKLPSDPDHSIPEGLKALPVTVSKPTQ